MGAVVIAAGTLAGRSYGPGRPGGAARRRGDALAMQGLAVGLLAIVLAYLAVTAVHGVWR